MRKILPSRLGRALAGGAILWLIGMVIGAVVFAIPPLRSAPEIPYVAANPFITVPILLTWPLLARRLAQPHVAAADPLAEGIRVGLVFLAVNAVLDRAIVVGLMGAGAEFYSYAGLWLAYATLVFAPWSGGRGWVRRRVGAED